MAKFLRFEGAFSWFFIELETHSEERDICLIATAQRPNCFYNKGYIAYFYCACTKRPYFHLRSKIWRRHRVPRPQFHMSMRRGNFCDSAINKRYIAYFFYSACAKRPYFCSRFENVFSWFFSLEKQMSAIFYFRFIWPADLEACHVLSHPRWLFPPSLKLIRLSITELQRCWCGYVTWPCDLGLWPKNLLLSALVNT